MDSSDEALCEMLGMKSLEVVPDEVDDDDQEQNVDIRSIVNEHQLSHLFRSEAICVFPKALSVPSAVMRRLTDELVWGKDVQADRTYEAIKVLKNGEVLERRTLTRLENFVRFHTEWNELCNGHLRDCISSLLGEEMVLYKEKLNLKPPGGSGFAPHLDTPSLRIAFGPDGPQTFVTVMVAIDNMTKSNGCLRVCKGAWSEEKHCPLIPPEAHGNPDAGGRAGAIPLDAAQNLDFDDVEVQGGDIVAFQGWAPHRSSANGSPFPRRAVFLTYNPMSEGDFHQRYYQRMDEIRGAFRRSAGLISPEEKQELDALETIPTI